MDSTSTIDSPLLSPAKARQVAIQAKDWAYVNSWLSRQYSPQPVPPFERNEDTLRTLLSLAVANDAADDEAALLHRAREEALQEYKARESSRDRLKSELLNTVEMGLDEKGRRDLDDLAASAVALGTLTPNARELGQAIVELTMEEFDAKDQIAKLNALQKYLDAESEALRNRLLELTTDKAYEIPSDLPILTAEWSRSAKILAAKVGEYQSRTGSLLKNRYGGPTIQDVVMKEEDIMRLDESVRRLENEVSLFHGLPKDVHGARSEYKRLEQELTRLRRRRDAMFEELGERQVGQPWK